MLDFKLPHPERRHPPQPLERCAQTGSAPLTQCTRWSDRADDQRPGELLTQCTRWSDRADDLHPDAPLTQCARWSDRADDLHPGELLTRRAQWSDRADAQHPDASLARRVRWNRRFAALSVIAFCAAYFAAMCLLSGVAPGAYPYHSYLLQARAWLQGRFALDQNYEYLELAIYNGRYYVSFPPVPTIPMLLWTLIWGMDVPGGLFQKIYVALACLAALYALARSRTDEPKSLRREFERRRIPEPGAAGSAIWAIFLCFASALPPIALVGGVWFEAQILAFLFSVCAIAAMRGGRPTLSCLLYALSVGCRPFSVCLGPVLLALHLRRTRDLPRGLSLRRLIPGIAVGLCVAACYAAYNYARFGDPFEFGHNYLPEFQIAEHGQFSPAYIANNWRIFFFGSPFTVRDGRVVLEEFGFSMFLSCPILLCNLIWFVSDLAKRRLCPEKLVVIGMMLLNTFLLLMHRTPGAHQFGLRYALELVPLSFAYLLLSPERACISRWEFLAMSFGLIFNFVGGVLVHV